MKLLVGRPPVNPKGKKVKRSVTLDPELLKWVMAQTGPGLSFSNLSGAVEAALYELKAKERDKRSGTPP
jgi:hypothetical protein